MWRAHHSLVALIAARLPARMPGCPETQHWQQEITATADRHLGFIFFQITKTLSGWLSPSPWWEQFPGDEPSLFCTHASLKDRRNERSVSGRNIRWLPPRRPFQINASTDHVWPLIFYPGDKSSGVTRLLTPADIWRGDTAIHFPTFVWLVNKWTGLLNTP